MMPLSLKLLMTALVLCGVAMILTLIAAAQYGWHTELPTVWNYVIGAPLAGALLLAFGGLASLIYDLWKGNF